MATCSVCGEGHDDVHDLVATLAQDRLNRIPSRDLLDEAEALGRTLREAELQSWPPGAVCYEKHRWEVIGQEARRRLELEDAVREGTVTGRLRDLKAVVDIIKQRDIRDLLEDLGWLPAGPERNGRYHYRCPWHGDGRDRNASGVVYAQEQRWWCFGCSAGGDAIDLVKAHLHLEFGDAVRWLAKRFDLRVPNKKPPTRPPASGLHQAYKDT